MDPKHINKLKIGNEWKKQSKVWKEVKKKTSISHAIPIVGDLDRLSTLNWGLWVQGMGS